jgi:ankyrin repeat protein
MNRRIVTAELFQSCQDGKIDCRILASIKQLTSLRDFDNRSLLDVAVQYKHVDIVQQLLQYDFISTNASKEAVLRAAAISGDCRIFEMIHDKAGLVGAALVQELAMITCEHGHIGIFQYLLLKHPNDHSFSMTSGLIAACKNNHPDMARELIKVSAYAPTRGDCVLTRSLCQNVLGPDVDYQPLLDVLKNVLSRDFSDRSSWYIVGESGNMSLLNNLISRGLDNEECIQWALNGACKCLRYDVFDRLLCVTKDKGYSVNFPDLLHKVYYGPFVTRPSTGSGSTYIFDDIRHTHRLLSCYEESTGVSTATNISDEASGDMKRIVIQIPNNDLLAYACVGSHIDIVKRLLDACDCDVNAVVGDHTPLSRATDPAIIKLLLDAKAQVNPEGSISTLRTACEKLKPDAVKTLLEAGARTSHQLLNVVVSAPCADEQIDDKVAVLHLLLDAGAKTRAGFGDSALSHCLTCEPSRDVLVSMKTLIQRDPGMLDLRDFLKLTPLMRAVNRCKPATVNFLIEAGADVTIVDRYNNSALSHVFSVRQEDPLNVDKREILRMLLDAGASPLVYTDHTDSVTMFMQICSQAFHIHRHDPISKYYRLDYSVSILLGDVFDHIVAFGPGNGQF